MENPAPQGRRVTMARLGLPAQLDLPVKDRDSPARLDLQGQLAPQALLVLRVIRLALQARRVSLVRLDLKVSLALQGRPPRRSSR